MSLPEDEDADEEIRANWSLWRFMGKWPMIAAISLGLLFLTFNPLLSGLLPYLRAGWPAFQTAVWLKQSDPWKARGTVGLVFHLCMAGFLAGSCGVACIVGTILVADAFNREPNQVALMIALGAILFGCLLSFIFGWLGVVIAVRHRIRVYVMSNLYQVCRGDFRIAMALPPHVHRTNPANFIIAIAATVPLLALWFVMMLASMPAPGNNEEETKMVLFVLSLLPLVGIMCIAVVVFLSRRIMASSPADCWGADIPTATDEETNWYRAAD